MTQILIDISPTERGWGYYAPYFRCAHLGGLTKLGLVDDQSDPRIRGRLGHTAFAHLHQRWLCQQQGQDPTLYYPPEDAMHAHCQQHPEGWPHLPRMLECFRRYVARFPDPPGRRIVGVECVIAGVLGTLDGQWGLWALLDPDDVESPAPRHVSGRSIQPSLLDCPGHADHGKNVTVTRKLDLVIEDTTGKLFILDSKFKASDVSERTKDAYAMSGEFAVSRILGQQVWPGAEIGLWLVQTTAPWRVARPMVPDSPWRDQLFPRDLLWKAHEIARLELAYPDPHRYPMAQNETTCTGRYERDGCPARLACMQGPSRSS